MIANFLATAAVWLAAGAAIAADPAPSPEAVAFGAREYVSDMSLSPDGTKVAMVQPDGARGTAVTVVDLVRGGSPKLVMRTSGDPERLRRCRWATSDRLVCWLFVINAEGGLRLGYTRMIAFDADGGVLKLLTQQASSRALAVAQHGGDVIDWTAGETDGGVLITRVHVPENETGTRMGKALSGLGVDRLNTRTLARTVIEQPRNGAVDYITDGLGHVRVMGWMGSNANGHDANAISYSYRATDSREWKPLGSLALTGTGQRGFNPYAVDPASNQLYGFDDVGGHRALARIALDGSLKKEIVLAREDVDVDGLIRIGRQNRVVGASWATDRRNATFFDPELKALSESLGRALPAKPLVTFMDASANEKHLLLFAGSDNDPGRYYLYDKTTRKLEEILPSRPRTEKLALARMTPIRFPAADGTMIPGYLTVPAGSNGKQLPAIVMPHGGPAARDEWGFDWLVQFFASRGFAVLQPNFRGSAGYGQAWFQKNGFQSWRTAIGDVNDGARWLVSQGIAAPGKLGIVGWSYGGYAALQSSAVDPDLFKAVVAIAPVTDLETLRLQARPYSNYRQVDGLIGTGRHVVEGSPARNVDRIKAPVLMFHGDLDLNVAVEQSRFMAERLKAAGRTIDYREYRGLDHQLDDSAVRIEMLDRADLFLKAALKP